MEFKINQFLNEDIKNSAHPSDFDATDEYGVFILRLPGDEVKSYAFLIKDKVYLYNREKDTFEVLGEFNDLYNFLDTKLDEILAKLNKFHILIEELEDSLYEDEIKDFSNRWLEIKKDVILYERLISQAIIPFERFLKHYKLNNFEFKDLKEHLQRAYNYAKSAREKLDYIYDYYRAKQDEKMNKIMFVLTLLSGIFLPLTLVTGYFGMNTGGLPWVNDSLGTFKATILGIILEIPIIFMLWRMMK